MKIEKVIYFIRSNFCQRDFKRFGIEIMKNNGFLVEIWDLTPFLNPEAYKTLEVPDPIDYQKSNCRLFIKKEEAVNEIKNLKQDAIIISMMVFDYKTYFLYRELSKKDILYSLVYTNAIPMYKNVSGSYSFFNRCRLIHFLKKIRELNLGKIKKNIFRKIPFNWLMIQLPAFIFAGGSQSIVNYPSPIGLRTKVIWGHTLDYDLYLKDLQQTSKNELASKKYIVFIDAYMPFHPDYIHMNIKPPIAPEIYYQAMCKFFYKVEKETGLKVIIAAHPRSKYEEHPDYFDGRKVIRGKTMELVRDSEFVLMHSSTSLNFAVLYHKPVLFLTLVKMEQSKVFTDYIRMVSSELNKGFITIDSDYKIDWDKELKIDEEAYANYKEKYIKRRNTKEEFFWQIVADEIKKL